MTKERVRRTKSYGEGKKRRERERRGMNRREEGMEESDGRMPGVKRERRERKIKREVWRK